MLPAGNRQKSPEEANQKNAEKEGLCVMNMEKLKADYGNVLWSGKKCILGMPISFTRYVITDTTLYTRIGLFNIREDEIEL